jgi:predicted permease
VLRVDVGELEDHAGLAQTEIVELREGDGPFEAVESAIFGSATLTLESRVVWVNSAGVTPGLLETLGAIPSQGRLLNASDSWDRVVVLSHSFWERAFAGDPGIIGRVVTLHGTPREVVGVLEPDFRVRLGPGSNASAKVDLWRIEPPLRTNPESGFLWGWNALVRLKDGISFGEADEYLKGFVAAQRQKYPNAYADSRLRFSVTPLLDDLVREVRPVFRAATLGVVLLLLTAVVNAWVLLTLAGKRREKELVVRRALGAGRGVLALEALMEALILGSTGVGLGWLLAAWGLTAVRASLPRAVPRWETITFGWEPAVWVGGLTLLALILAGVAPVWKSRVAAHWRGMPRSPGSGGGLSVRGQTALVGVQIALAVVLLFGAVQLARSVRGLATTDLGFRPEKVLTLRVALEDPGFTAEDKPRENLQYHRIRDRLGELAGVQAVGAVSTPPLGSRGTVNTYSASPENSTVARGDQVAHFFAVLPGYFDSMAIPVVLGRSFTDQENLSGRPVAIIDERLAATAFPDTDPIGLTLSVHVPGGSQSPRLPDPRIVGVVRHARVIDPTRSVHPQVYLPFGFWRWAPLHFTLRAEADPTQVLPAARAVVEEVVPNHPVSGTQLLADNLDAHTGTLRAIALLVVALALSASLLSAMGLFAVTLYVVVREKKAMAVRGALGADRWTLVGEQLRARMAVLLFSIPAGVLLSLWASRLLESIVYEVDVRDVGSLMTSAAMGGCIGFLGTLAPAWRAARADPAKVLRED